MSKNLCPENNLSFENSQTVRFETPLPAGTYTSSAVVKSTDTDSSLCLMLFYYADGTTKESYISRSVTDERVSKTETFTQDVTRVRIYASEGYNPSVGDIGTFTNLMIEAGSVATDYMPYGDESESEHWDNAETIAYYMALASEISTDILPVPTCRETMLLRKLLDPSYEIPFIWLSSCSRAERYLMDLVNGTTDMLINIPKSDKEKYLHVAIGGTVDEMPNPDASELNYWMNQWIESRKEG